MGHRDGAALLDLAAEEGHDRAARAEDVAEAHDHELAAGRRAGGGVDDDALGEELRGAVDRYGIDGLVRRDRGRSAATPAARAASTRLRVPSTLLCTAATGFSSIMGTCL